MISYDPASVIGRYRKTRSSLDDSINQQEDSYLPKRLFHVGKVSFWQPPSGRSLIEIAQNNSPAIRNLIPQSHLEYPSFQRQVCCIGRPSGQSYTSVVNEKTFGLNESLEAEVR